jgi:hypothetical protein
VDLYWHVKEMVASNIGRQEANLISEKLDQMEAKYDASIIAILTSDEDSDEKDDARKTALDAAAEGKEAGTPSDPIALETDACKS